MFRPRASKCTSLSRWFITRYGTLCCFTPLGWAFGSVAQRSLMLTHSLASHWLAGSGPGLSYSPLSQIVDWLLVNKMKKRSSTHSRDRETLIGWDVIQSDPIRSLSIKIISKIKHTYFLRPQSNESSDRRMDGWINELSVAYLSSSSSSYNWFIVPSGDKQISIWNLDSLVMVVVVVVVVFLLMIHTHTHLRSIVWLIDCVNFENRFQKSWMADDLLVSLNSSRRSNNSRSQSSRVHLLEKKLWIQILSLDEAGDSFASSFAATYSPTHNFELCVFLFSRLLWKQRFNWFHIFATFSRALCRAQPTQEQRGEKKRVEQQLVIHLVHRFQAKSSQSSQPTVHFKMRNSLIVTWTPWLLTALQVF